MIQAQPKRKPPALIHSPAANPTVQTVAAEKDIAVPVVYGARDSVPTGMQPRSASLRPRARRKSPQQTSVVRTQSLPLQDRLLVRRRRRPWDSPYCAVSENASSQSQARQDSE